MIACIDTSVLMRVVLTAPDPLREWPEIHRFVASRLVRTEGLRTLDQLWHWGKLAEDELAEKRRLFVEFMPRFGLVPLDDEILEAAARPLPTNLATLDAIHLVTAMRYRAAQPPDERPIVIATHDTQLARAARAMHFEVIGA